MRMSVEFMRFQKIINAVDVHDANKNEIMVWMDTEERDYGHGSVTFSKFGGTGSTAKMVCNENVDTTIFMRDEAGVCQAVITVHADESNEFMAIAKDVIKFLNDGTKP